MFIHTYSIFDFFIARVAMFIMIDNNNNNKFTTKSSPQNFLIPNKRNRAAERKYTAQTCYKKTESN
jgi:hypothetical protein